MRFFTFIRGYGTIKIVKWSESEDGIWINNIILECLWSKNLWILKLYLSIFIKEDVCIYVWSLCAAKPFNRLPWNFRMLSYTLPRWFLWSLMQIRPQGPAPRAPKDPMLFKWTIWIVYKKHMTVWFNII